MEFPKTTIAAVIIGIAIIGGIAYEHYLSSQKPIIVLATTTSVYDSGMLDYLIPKFENKHHAEVHVISVGTGQAIEIGRRGDADIVLVHSKNLELSFVNSTYGIHRIGVFYNDFIIVGPASDPAGIKNLTNSTEAFRRICERGFRGDATFVSRADKSGTNMFELKIWSMLGITPSNKTYAWYIEAGTGMGSVLRISNEKGSYTLTDRSTWLSFKRQLKDMDILVQDDKILTNPYAIILVNPEKYPNRNYKGALALAKFMISNEGQELIANYKKNGEMLFKPLARKIELARELGFPDQSNELAWYDKQKP
ncbi:substrate-binding domain-containing protein [Candidatus Bathyarchaeota archaeon]|nr:substrate-binding domain-containing protein [Candidatus Bathyarchaeota archaeon]MBS7628376.1 substrate-binding domain-containing protein [Candidatus Bathyarchaeota archaeon]